MLYKLLIKFNGHDTGKCLPDDVTLVYRFY